MHIFSCPACAAHVYFDNLTCRCGQKVTFDPDRNAMRTDAAVCANRGDIACNWLAEDGGLCRSCAMTGTVPDMVGEENRELWARTELAHCA